MKDQPEGFDASELTRALTAWEIDAVSLTYAPVGFGDHHWTAADAREGRWFSPAPLNG
jgi:spectinomycin phosphotransferase